MYMPSIFNNSVFDNFDNWMDFSFPSFNQRLYGASSSQLMKTDVRKPIRIMKFPSTCRDLRKTNFRLS